MKVIDSLVVGINRTVGLRFRDLQSFVADRDPSQFVLRFNGAASNRDEVVYDLVDCQEMFAAEELRYIDPDSRWLLAEKDSDLRRGKTETMKQWHARVDSHIKYRGYFVDESGYAHWFAITEGAEAGAKAVRYNTVNYEGRNYRLFKLPEWAEMDDEEIED